MARGVTDKLTARDRQIAARVAAGDTYAEAGQCLNLSERTVRRAMTRPAVRAEVEAIRARAVEGGLGVLCGTFAAAVREMARLCLEGTAADAVRLAAARSVIDATLKV